MSHDGLRRSLVPARVKSSRPSGSSSVVCAPAALDRSRPLHCIARREDCAILFRLIAQPAGPAGSGRAAAVEYASLGEFDVKPEAEPEPETLDQVRAQHIAGPVVPQVDA